MNALRFRTSPYSGTSPFAVQRWRIGEITRPAGPSWLSAEPWKYEIEPVWESGPRPSFTNELALPAGLLRPGRVYRARVQVQDAAGRPSRWTAPVEFTAGEPAGAELLAAHLRLSELMYAPADGTDWEYVELHNTSADTALDLSGLRFRQGIDFTFPAGARLAPGTYGLVIKTNETAFRAYYGLAAGVPLFGPFGGSLDNAGERVVLRTAAGGTDLFDFEYGRERPWPSAASAGHSLVLRPVCLIRQAARSTGAATGAPAPSSAARRAVPIRNRRRRRCGRPGWPATTRCCPARPATTTGSRSTTAVRRRSSSARTGSSAMTRQT